MKEKRFSGRQRPNTFGCQCGKRGYSSRRDAKQTVKDMRRIGDHDPQRINVYECLDVPGVYHIGHGWREMAPDMNNPHIRFV